MGNIFRFFNFFDKRGWGYAPMWEMGVSMTLQGDATTPRIFGVTKMSPSLLLNPQK
jgi:hypothetical protein